MAEEFKAKAVKDMSLLELEKQVSTICKQLHMVDRPDDTFWKARLNKRLRRIRLLIVKLKRSPN